MKSFIPYGRHTLDEDDVSAVVGALLSGTLTGGALVTAFEADLCAFCETSHAVAVSSGTSALHTALHALGVQPEDEVIVPPLTFAATANSVLYCGAKPVFADVCPETLLLDPTAVEAAITPCTKVIIGVDYAGHPCDWDALRSVARRHSVTLVADACHSLGARYKNRPVGTLADITVLSFHPVKHITTCEGGACLTSQRDLAHAMRVFRNHGITSTPAERAANVSWHYEMVDLGYNYRISDVQCALGSSQLRKLPEWLLKRRDLAAQYDALLENSQAVPLVRCDACCHAYHLYTVRVRDRDNIFRRMREANIGVNVHYIPVHLHPYYKNNLGTSEGMFPVAEAAYKEILSLPMWPGLSEEDLQRICSFFI